MRTNSAEEYDLRGIGQYDDHSMVFVTDDMEDNVIEYANDMYSVRDTQSYAPRDVERDLVTNHPVLTPLKGQTYFKPRERKAKTVVGVVIPFYNEGRQELERTLESLYDQEIECGDLGVEFVYLAIMDGITKADESMIDYLKEIYDDSEWADTMLSCEDKSYVSILQASPTDESGDHGLVEIAPGKHLRLTTLVKGMNKRKTNSHEWFFVAYCPEYEIDYGFATDCGTLYAQGCLYYLIDYLDNHPDVSAVTGRQRVMSSSMQSLRTEGLMQMWYRAVQSYDYEASISSFLGAFSLIGMLPVLPGPAGLWRMSVVGGKPMDYYVDYINSIKPEDGLIMGNLLLAEDRILSYAACLMTGKFTRWVPKAVFYTEAETDSKAFLTQRRRWINGTFASYLFLLFFSPGVIFRGPHSWSFKIIIYSQLLLQTILYTVTAVSPAIFATLIYFAVKSLNIGGSEYNQYVAWAINGFSAFMYLIFCATHFLTKFSRSLYNAVVTWNTLSFMVIVASVAVTFANADPIAILILLLAVFMPFFLALLHSLDVFIMMLFSFFQFFIFLPTFIPWFSAYSYCRVWDLSWGNRPSSGSAEGKEANKTEILHKRIGLAVLLIVMSLNFTVCGLFMAYNNSQALMMMSMVMVGISLMQQILSFIFYLFYTEHMLTAGVQNVNRKWMKFLSGTLFVITVVCMFTGTFTSSWLTNSVEVYNRSNSTIVMNQTVTAFTGPYLTQLSKEDFREQEGDKVLADANHAELVIVNTTGYAVETVQTVTKIYNMDPLKDLALRIDLNQYKFSAYYVNNTVITNYLVNITLGVNGTIANQSATRMTTYVEYLNVSYYDGFDNHYGDVMAVSDRDYRNGYITIEDFNQTVVRKDIEVVSEEYDGYVNLAYGIFFISYDFHTITPFKSETISWGQDLMWHYPNTIWSYTVILMVGCVIFLSLVVLATCYALTVKDKSRVYGVAVVYVWFTIIGLFTAILLFPLSFADLDTYHVGWWNPDNKEQQYLCGESAGFYNSGDCNMGWSYWLVVVSFITAVFSYHSAQITLEKPEDVKKVFIPPTYEFDSSAFTYNDVDVEKEGANRDVKDKLADCTHISFTSLNYANTDTETGYHSGAKEEKSTWESKFRNPFTSRSGSLRNSRMFFEDPNNSSTVSMMNSERSNHDPRSLASYSNTEINHSPLSERTNFISTQYSNFAELNAYPVDI
ncbi:hypothetical protein SARC_00625 [Sphaeroforma arctica JP610]|uniref:chitin synthase n=1 Tax=Sphaeroforma arctica JP610 TaxID=667725 RepID=A0A0L0GEB2_9EUKA|nr:hypothetical protein SARC_00625 [Sphaeroforma arctica JP610]KNC87239.1 hypothetical protein SARC_00625 [Sphaeroforma arctica JP610]|eukprot:XP_014161141.1 hypothetical protein SARC_00625 [Sphaeroforma arctica JP610]